LMPSRLPAPPAESALLTGSNADSPGKCRAEPTLLTGSNADSASNDLSAGRDDRSSGGGLPDLGTDQRQGLVDVGRVAATAPGDVVLAAALAAEQGADGAD